MGLLYFRDAVGTTDSGFMGESSTFLGCRLAGAGSVKFNFIERNNNVDKHTSVTVAFTGAFKDAMQAVAGALNSDTMTVISDDVNGIHLNYPGGSFGTASVDDQV